MSCDAWLALLLLKKERPLLVCWLFWPLGSWRGGAVGVVGETGDGETADGETVDHEPVAGRRGQGKRVAFSPTHLHGWDVVRKVLFAEARWVWRDLGQALLFAGKESSV